MATFLDLGVLSGVSIIFTFLFVFAVIFAILQKTKPLGSMTGINALVAVVVGLLAILSKDVIGVVDNMIPWFVLLIIFVLLILTVFMMFGAKDENFSNLVRSNSGLQWVIIAISIIIVITSISNVYGQRLVPSGGNVTEVSVEEGSTPSTQTDSFNANMRNIFFHPKIIGMIFIMLVAVFAIALLTIGPSK